MTMTMFAACGKSESTDSASTETAATANVEKSMVIGDTTFNAENWEETINPHVTYNGWPCIRYGVGETLVHYTDTMELEPWLATSWENDGDKVWTITLRDGVKFSSGRDMDAEAVKQCFEHLLENHDRAPSDTKIESMEADGLTLKITTSEANPALMNYLGDPYACIIDVDASDFDNGIVAGTGPYKATELVTDDHLSLVPNDYYWNGTPKLSSLTIKTISDGDTLSAALLSGDIDAAYGMAYEAYPNFENDNFQFSSIQTSRAFFASMNMTSPVIKDDAVRKAIAMGIDKEGFVATLLDGHGVVGNGAFPDGFSKFGGENIKTEAYNPEEAKKILEDAGWVDSDGDGIREKDGKDLVIRWL
ncbi:MAG: ABC transporter substrate-binding protein, partial [Pseudobutyrivibrio sp.]|nr:ABC transporter substrate-binding protein [Pseudobutyrivibrio sp.]